MFWKKKKNSDSPKIWLPDDDDPREVFRVRPPEEEPMPIKFGPSTTTVYEISASGLSCPCDQARIGDKKPVIFNLPGEGVRIKAQVEIVRIGDRPTRVCGCRFIDLAPEMAEAIHRYVLRVQKIELQKRKESDPEILDGSDDSLQGVMNPLPKKTKE